MNKNASPDNSSLSSRFAPNKGLSLLADSAGDTASGARGATKTVSISPTPRRHPMQGMAWVWPCRTPTKLGTNLEAKSTLGTLSGALQEWPKGSRLTRKVPRASMQIWNPPLGRPHPAHLRGPAGLHAQGQTPAHEVTSQWPTVDRGGTGWAPAETSWAHPGCDQSPHKRLLLGRSGWLDLVISGAAGFRVRRHSREVNYTNLNTYGSIHFNRNTDSFHAYVYSGLFQWSNEATQI